MTAQHLDTIELGGSAFDLCTPWGEGHLFDIATVGLTPQARSTNCWRGYHCGFRVIDRRIELDALHANMDESDIARAMVEGQPLALAHRSAEPEFEWFDGRWRDLGHPIEFTGAVLVGQDRSPRDMSGVAFAFEHVRGLLIEGGRITGEQELSAPIQRFGHLYHSLMSAAHSQGTRVNSDRWWHSGVDELRSLRDDALALHVRHFSRWVDIVARAPERADAAAREREELERSFQERRERYARRTAQRAAMQARSAPLLAQRPGIENGAALDGTCTRCDAAGTVYVHERDMLMCSACIEVW